MGFESVALRARLALQSRRASIFDVKAGGGGGVRDDPAHILGIVRGRPGMVTPVL